MTARETGNIFKYGRSVGTAQLAGREPYGHPSRPRERSERDRPAESG
jgi:hypothetical protein